MTFVRTGKEVNFADPYKVCLECGDWITGTVDIPDEPLILMPCEHRAVYKDLCPSWGPVDVCKCPPGEHAKP